MRSKSILVVLGVLLAFNSFAQAVTIDFVTIGNPGNAPDTQIMNDDDGTTGYGAVGYEYQIGKYEVTNAQWNAFTTAAGAPTGNPSNAYDESSIWSGTNVPTNNISWYEAAQFCNYLTSGDKSQGAYQFSGNNTDPCDFLGIDRDTAISAYDKIYVIPTEDEWYKAAYYTGSGYSIYANGTDVAPIAGVDTNYDQDAPFSAGPWDFGTGTMEQNGTYDIMGNVWEWNEAWIGTHRSHRGGSYMNSDDALRSSYRTASGAPYVEYHGIGFRVASVPEPATLLLLALGGLALRRKRSVK